MGWTFPYDASRRDVIAELTTDRVTDGRVFKTLRKCFRGNTMYALHESGPEGETRKWLAVYLLQRSQGSWGYKDMDESMGPYYYDCPVSYLDAADEPVSDTARDWRNECRSRAAARAAKKPRKGETWTLVGCRIPHVKILSLKPLRGMAKGTVYKIKRSLLGDKLEESPA
jgi:hypothetical protein